MSTEHYIGPTATSSIDENADMLEVFKRLGGSHHTSGGTGDLGASAESGLAQQEPSHE